MSRVVRVLGAAGVAALALLSSASPAVAAAPGVTIDAPVADTTQTGPFAISGGIYQGGNGAVVTSASVSITSIDGWPTDPAQEYRDGGAKSPIYSGSGASVTYNWANVLPKYNGRYTVSVAGTGHSNGTFGPGPDQTNVVSKSFNVEVKPVAPTGVTASKPETSSLVSVAWKANPEPDIAFYQVYRSYQGDSGRPIGSPVAPSASPKFTDDLAGRPVGAYKYAVQAIRHARSCKGDSSDEACDRGIPGSNSAYSSSVTVRGTPVTTTTTTTTKPNNNGGGGGSGGGGGNSGGGGSGGSGSGSGSGSSGGGSTKGSGTARGGSGGGGFAPGGEVDLSKFGSLLNGKSRSATGRGGENEGTYDGTLPYDPSEGPVDGGDDDNSLITIGGASLPAPSDDWVRFIGAGSLATALLVHVLWFKQQVDAIPLEPLIE